jgi:hypothetical protein
MLRYIFAFVIVLSVWANLADAQVYVNYIYPQYTSLAKQLYFGQKDTVGYYDLIESTGCPFTFVSMNQYGFTPFKYDVSNLGTSEHPKFRVFVFLTPNKTGSITDSAVFYFSYQGLSPCGSAYDSIKLITAVTNIQSSVLTTSKINNISFDIFPNPFQPRIVIHYVLHDNMSAKFSFHDILGNEVKIFEKEQIFNKEGSIPIDISFLTAGIYFCTLQTTSGTITKKIIRY